MACVQFSSWFSVSCRMKNGPACKKKRKAVAVSGQGMDGLASCLLGPFVGWFAAFEQAKRGGERTNKRK